MIYGIGTDIVRVDRMERILDRRGDRFARRILTEDELQDLGNAKSPARFLAKRFAAKEAAAKAIGTGFRGGLQLRHIGVGHDDQGRPLLKFNGHALQMLRERGILSAHLSLADEQEYAVAFVTLSTD